MSSYITRCCGTLGECPKCDEKGLTEVQQLKSEIESLRCEKADLESKFEQTKDALAKSRHAHDITNERFADLESKLCGIRDAIPFPGLDADAANAMAFHLEQGKDNGDISYAAIAVWLRGLANELKAFAEACDLILLRISKGG